MHESGLIRKWRERWWGKKKVCQADLDAKKWKPLDLESVAGAFIMVACAVGLGLVYLILEYIFQRLRGGRGMYEFDTERRGRFVTKKRPVQTVSGIANGGYVGDDNIEMTAVKNENGVVWL
jgi:hypothetical protein